MTPMQTLVQGGGSASNGSYIPYFTTPYAAIPSYIDFMGLTTYFYYIISISQPHSNPCLSLPHRPPGSQPPVSQGRLGRSGLHFVPL